jgi:hypothetical protein
VEHEHLQRCARTALAICQHFGVAGAIAECSLRPMSDEEIDVLGLAGVVVVE